MESIKPAIMLLFTGGLYTFLFVGPLSVLLMVFLTRVPKKHRQISVSRLWILAVPLVHIVWLYVAVTRVSKSFQKYFASGGRQEQGDCGYGLGLAMVVAVWAMAAAPTVAYLLHWEEQVDVAIVACGLTVFALFASYVVRMLTMARTVS